MKKLLLLAALGVLMGSCATQSTALYSWQGYDDAVYAYTKTSDEKSVEGLMTVYNKLIQSPGGSRKVPPPGVCADYGYLLVQAGNIDEGKELLRREISLYPESKPFIDRILKRLES